MVRRTSTSLGRDSSGEGFWEKAVSGPGGGGGKKPGSGPGGGGGNKSVSGTAGGGANKSVIGPGGDVRNKSWSGPGGGVGNNPGSVSGGGVNNKYQCDGCCGSCLNHLECFPLRLCSVWTAPHGDLIQGWARRNVLDS